MRPGLFTDRREWLDSAEGELSRHRARSAERLLVHTRLEPRSKNAITRAESDAFAEALHREMGRRTGFRSPIAVELDLHATADNPPEIHTVAKNYIDLLYRQRAGRGRVCIDDRQIRYLAVSYTLKMLDRPAVILRAHRLSRFHEDVRLAGKIRADTFGHVSDDRDEARLADAIDGLREWERSAGHIVTTYGAPTFGTQQRHLLMRFQRSWLSVTEEVLHRSLLMLLGRRNAVPSEPLELGGMRFPAIDFGDLEKRFLLSDSVSLGLAPIPQKSGEGKAFKEAIVSSLSGLRTAEPRRFPLLVELGVVILLVPPTGGGIDLDNLARKVIPLVHGVLEPPVAGWSPDPESMSDPDIRRYFQEEEHRRRRLPKHHLTRYEVIELPRTKSDPPAGTVRLVLCNGLGGQTFGEFVRDTINRWAEEEPWR